MPANAPIRVLHIITRLSVGGAQENTLLSVEGLDQIPEFDCVLLTGTDDGTEGSLIPRAEKSTRLLTLPELGREVNPLLDLKSLFLLRNIIREGRYHIVHTHMSKAGVVGRWAAKMAGTPFIVHTLHSLVFHDYQPWLVNRMWWAIKKICAPITDHFISVSRLIAEKAIAEGISAKENFTTIYSGMELDWFLNAKVDRDALRRELGIPLDAPVIGKIARLFPLKGHKELMDAAPEVVKRHPNVRFLLLGDGVLRQELEEQATALGIRENFVFAGMVPRERVPILIGAMDILVHTSLREGLARVLPQALAMGKPCVSFALDGAPEVVIDGRTGFLVQPNDIPGLADALSKLVNDPDLRARMGAEGRKVVDPAFRTETMVQEIAKVYRNLLAKHPERIERFNRKHGL